ncbi:MAG: MFS transporter [Pelistega sp.]|nr:MFS transporter [Pelistega sp.]
MKSSYFILFTIILIFLPVTIDATILHLAVPTLTRELSFTTNQMLWVIDIYSIVMASFILSMGALGDRIGYKKQLAIGSIIFGLGSLGAGLSTSAEMLIVARAFLGLGAAMILPGTLAAIRQTFENVKQRNIALGVWGATSAGGAAFGPLLGGYILEHYEWGMIFLINIPLVLLVLVLIFFFMPKQAVRRSQTVHIAQSIILVMGILGLIYALKAAFNGLNFSVVAIFLAGAVLLGYFIRTQQKAANPMVDLRLFRHPVVISSMLLTLFAIFAIVGFELLLSQELQFVNRFSPLETGFFILPLMLTVSISGPLIGFLSNRFPLQFLTTFGLLLCSLSFFFFAQIHFVEQQVQACLLMMMLGFGIELALLTSTAALMSTVPSSKATAAGAIGGMAYELGTGLGIALFGLLLSFFYQQVIVLPPEISSDLSLSAASRSIGEAFSVAQNLPGTTAAALQQAASSAFVQAHSKVLWMCAGLYFMLALFISYMLRKRK